MSTPELLQDPAYHAFWAAFHRAGTLAQRGQTFPAIQQLQSLLADPRRCEFDPDRNVEYTLAITFLSTPGRLEEWAVAAKLLRELVDEEDSGVATERNGALVRVELAAALIQLGRFTEAAQVAEAAIARMQDNSLPLTLAYQNLGRAQLELDLIDDAPAAFLTMLDVALAVDRLLEAGIAAEWLSRIALRGGEREAAAIWLDLSQDVYRATAPRHLRTSADLVTEINTGQPRASLDVLPPQARSLRARVLPAGEVGDWAGINLDSLDVDLGALWRFGEHSAYKELGTTIMVPSSEGSVRAAVRAHLATEAHAVLPHDWSDEILGALLQELWPDRAARILKRMRTPDSAKWEYRSERGTAGDLVWMSSGAGPGAFGIWLQGLAVLFVAGYQTRLSSRKKAFEAFARTGHDPVYLSQFFNLSDRAWPRPLQLWMILQGQALSGGQMGPSHLAEDPTRLRIISSEENRRAFAAMDYSPEESEDLDRGGLVALRASELGVPGAPPPIDIGTTPLGEVGLANPPLTTDAPVDKSRPGFVIDREYNTWFFAPSPTNPDRAWYGASNSLFRDHFDRFRSQLEIAGSVRAKHYSIPIIQIGSRADLARVTTLLDETAEWLKPTGHVEQDARTWYRGQSTAYSLQRTESVQRFLYGRSDVVEPSLPGAAPRRGWNYHKMHSFLYVRAGRVGRKSGYGTDHGSATSSSIRLAENPRSRAVAADDDGTGDERVLLAQSAAAGRPPKAPARAGPSAGTSVCASITAPPHGLSSRGGRISSTESGLSSRSWKLRTGTPPPPGVSPTSGRWCTVHSERTIALRSCLLSGR